MGLHHIAIWTFRLEELREFYTRYFGGTSNEKYINPKKGFESYFISFEAGPPIELMSRKDVKNIPFDDNRIGLTHLAFTFPSKKEVIRFTEEMRAAGFTIAGEPRTSGDGYFESVILDPDGNRLECVFEGDVNFISAPIILTERIILRPFCENDAEAVFASCQNPKIGNNAGWTPHQSIEESRTVLHNIFMDQPNIWAITLKATNQLIGSIGLMPDSLRNNPEVQMIGYWLDEAHWGKGYMKEAAQAVIKYGFEALEVSLITANCYAHNERSQHVLKSCGFILEGTLHQAGATDDGCMFDLQSYYLTHNKTTL